LNYGAYFYDVLSVDGQSNFAVGRHLDVNVFLKNFFMFLLVIISLTNCLFERDYSWLVIR